MMKRFALVALLAVSLFSVTACQKNEEPANTTTETATESTTTTTGTEAATPDMGTTTESTESTTTETSTESTTEGQH